MKSFVAKATLFILPLVAFSSQSFAAQALPALKSKHEMRMNHDQSIKKVSLHKSHSGCCQAHSSARSDDEMTESLPASRQLKSINEE